MLVIIVAQMLEPFLNPCSAYKWWQKFSSSVGPMKIIMTGLPLLQYFCNLQ